MARFTLKRLFASVTLIAIGCGQIAFLSRRARLAVDDPIVILAGLTSLPFICAGLLMPFKRTLIGACIGFVITILLLLLSESQ
jgi:hypothetical protein